MNSKEIMTNMIKLNFPYQGSFSTLELFLKNNQEVFIKNLFRIGLSYDKWYPNRPKIL